MSYPQPVLYVPRVLGDDAAELEAEINLLACKFFGSDVKLAFPQEYHAKLTGDRSSTAKLYMVEGLTVRRHWEGRPDTVNRRVDLPPVFGGNVIEIEAAIERMAIAFFGSDTRITPFRAECKVKIVPDAKDDKKYKAEDVTITQMAKWSQA
ncbi:hypothetical protein ACIBI3_25940 [Actinomadura luteofluorescens]|uniref:hypothetical protein n=1 Tax=Actinomadura luteofluorescens TaxID=46163 RepID=UPI003486E366